MSLSLYWLFVIVATFLYLSLRSINKQLHKNVNFPPGSLGWPIIGETSGFAISGRRGHLEKFMFYRMSRYSPDVFKTSLFGAKMAVLCGPSGNKFLFSNENKLVKSWLPPSICKIIVPKYQGDPDDLRMKVKMLASEFLKSDAIQKYVEIMDSAMKQHLDQKWAPNQTLTVFPLVKNLLFSLSCLLFMGIKDTNQMTKLQDQFQIVASGFASVPIDLPGTTFRRARGAFNVMKSELKKIIQQERIRLMSENKDDSGGSNLLTYLLSATDNEGKLLTEFEIVQTLITILIGSQHTTSSLITCILYYLADNPHVYDMALREQIAVKEFKGEAKKLLTWEDTKRMKYGRHVINEVLRLAPPGAGFFRNAIQDITYAGFTIPKGWKIYWSVHTTHKDPKYFPDPEKFDPTRFENGLVPFTFTPFGGGPRMCPGNEFARQVALVFMHNFLIKFKWEKLIPTEKIININASTIPANGLPIKLHRRHEPETISS